MKRNIAEVLNQTAESFRNAGRSMKAFGAYCADDADEGHVQGCLAALEGASIRYSAEDDDRHVIIRVPGLPRVDYFPSKNRWRAAGSTKRHFGTVDQLIAWIKETVR